MTMRQMTTNAVLLKIHQNKGILIYYDIHGDGDDANLVFLTQCFAAKQFFE